MCQPVKVAFEESEHPLSVQSLQALAIGLVDWRPEGLVVTDLTRCLVESLSISFTLHRRLKQRVRNVHQLGLVSCHLRYRLYFFGRR